MVHPEQRWLSYKIYTKGIILSRCEINHDLFFVQCHSCLCACQVVMALPPVIHVGAVALG